MNLCGYWLFPKSVELPEKWVAGATAPLTLTVENRGVAPPYAPYELRVKLSGAGTHWVQLLAKGCRSWMPGGPVASPYVLSLPTNLKPEMYELAIGLFEVSSGKDRPVEFALKSELRDAEGYYRVAKVPIAARNANSSTGH